MYAFPECIDLHLCAFNLIEAGLVKSWSFAVVGKRGCTEDCSQTALAPWAAEGCPATASPATFHQDKGEVFLCHHPHFLVLTSTLFHGSCHSSCSPWAEPLKASETKKMVWLTLDLLLLQRIFVTCTPGGILCGTGACREACGGGASNRESIW